METVPGKGHIRAGTGMAPTNLDPDTWGGVDPPGHRCDVPGYLQLPDLAMFWQCLACGETWQIVASRRAPGSPLEFVWVRDPVEPTSAQAS